MIYKSISILAFMLFFGLSIAVQAFAGGDKHSEALAAVMAIEGDSEYGEYLGAECLTCHSSTGANGAIPQIHGKDKSYLTSAILDYKLQQRDNAVMQGIVMALSDEEIAALVAYLSAQ